MKTTSRAAGIGLPDDADRVELSGRADSLQLGCRGRRSMFEIGEDDFRRIAHAMNASTEDGS
jgi:hypothetical protein